jgi:hypothetical protein
MWPEGTPKPAEDPWDLDPLSPIAPPEQQAEAEQPSPYDPVTGDDDA